MAGAGGIEPPNGGIKIHCLTTWLRPNSCVSGRANSPAGFSPPPDYKGRPDVLEAACRQFVVSGHSCTAANLAITGSQSTLLLNGARILGAPAAVAGAAIAAVQIGTYLNDHYVNKENAMEAGDRVAASRNYGPIAGGVAAAGYAIGSAAYPTHAPEAVVDYAKDNLTLDPSEIDWDRTLKPWK